jgi:hypothetical protein
MLPVRWEEKSADREIYAMGGLSPYHLPPRPFVEQKGGTFLPDETGGTR